MNRFNKYKKAIAIASLVALTFLISGCVLLASPKPPSAGGVFKSFDMGGTWQQKILFNQIGELSQTINDVNVRELVFYPGTTKSLYLLPEGNGFFYSYNQAERWQATLEAEGRINDLAIDPKNRSRVFAVFDKKILRSADCCGEWERIYLETREIQLTSLTIDPANSAHIYFTNSIGEIFESRDYGNSWQTLIRQRLVIQDLMINPKNSSIMYLVAGDGLYKAANKGKSWQRVDSLLKYPGTNEFKLLLFDLTKADAFYLVSKYGLLKTNDGGETWRPIPLLTPPGAVKIYSFAFNPKDQNELYYTTANTFYKTIDGGDNWLTKPLPSKRLPATLLLDYNEPGILYMGTTLGTSGQ